MPSERQSNPRAFLRVKEAAHRCSMSESLLMKICRAKQGPPATHKGRALFFEVEALDAWMRTDQPDYQEAATQR